MSNFDWAYPNTVWFGVGRINDLSKACKILNVKKPLLVTDKDLVKTQMIAKAVDINKKGIHLEVMFKKELNNSKMVNMME